MPRTTMHTRLSAALAAVVIVGAVGVGPAAAHVEPDPAQATKGGSGQIAFRVPTERDDASTVKVVIALPIDHPIASVTVQPKPGWTISVDKTKLTKPVQGDDGTVTEAVSRITWSGGKIAPGQFDDFTVLMDPLPSDTTVLVFKALQTYSDGQVVRWIEPTGPNGKEPDHPAPTVKLVAPNDSGSAPGAATTAPAARPASTTQAAATKPAYKKDVDSAKTIGLIGIALGVIGVLGAAVAISMGRRKSPG